MRFLLKLFTYSVIFALFIGFLAYFYYGAGLPEVEDFGKSDGKKVVQINFSNDEIITSYGNNNRLQAKFYELPAHLINAVISIEDQKFFTHHGFDLRAILRAFYINHKAGKIKQGASTITQQLAKMLFLSPEKTFSRKIQELILAFKIESHYSKEQIITLYLNHAYFGSGNYGIAEAAKYYFNKNVSALSLKESALLAGLLKAPSRLSPKNDSELAEERAEIVISNMIKWGFVDRKNIKELNEDIIYKTNRLQRLYFSDYVYSNFSEYLNKRDKKKKDKIIIKTTLNQRIQEKLESEMNEFTDYNSRRLKDSEIAVVIMDKNGAILALSGGRNYQKSQFNRAIYANRQAGSLFKTFVYLAAFQKGYIPQDIIEDKKIEFSDWLPNNYNKKYLGEVTLKEAFAKSLNSAAIQLAKKVKPKEIAKIAKKLGIVSKINKNDLTMALGTSSVNLLEITSAYSAILNNGSPVIPHSIISIQDKSDRILYSRQSSGFPSILNEETIRYTKEILRAAVSDGTAKYANISQKIHGKTGTSQDYRDAWFIGFDDRFTIGIWIGNDDNSKTENITGGDLPAKLFARIMGRL